MASNFITVNESFITVNEAFSKQKIILNKYHISAVWIEGGDTPTILVNGRFRFTVVESIDKNEQLIKESYE